MSDKSIKEILQEHYRTPMPPGFAERVALNAMSPERFGIWDALLRFSPKVGLALGTLATLLLILSFVGSGPDVLESVDQYNVFTTYISLP